MKKQMEIEVVKYLFQSEQMSDEIDKREGFLLELMDLNDWEMTSMFPDEGVRNYARWSKTQGEKDFLAEINTNVTRRKVAERDYLNRNKVLMLHHSKMRQKEAELEAMTKLSKGNTEEPSAATYKKRKMRIQTCGQPKVFGGDLEDLHESTGELVPAVVTCCVDIILKFGMNQQGIFRIGGSQVGGQKLDHQLKPCLSLSG